MNNQSDLDVALDFLRRIPEGRWTNYGEIAECVNTIQGTDHSGYRVAMLMLHCDASEPWHRLRNAEGVFNVPAHEGRNHADVQNLLDQRNRDEGCSVSGHRADPAKRVSAGQLLAMAPGRDKRLVAARAADPGLAARVAAKRAARLENR